MSNLVKMWVRWVWGHIESKLHGNSLNNSTANDDLGYLVCALGQFTGIHVFEWDRGSDDFCPYVLMEHEAKEETLYINELVRFAVKLFNIITEPCNSINPPVHVYETVIHTGISINWHLGYHPVLRIDVQPKSIKELTKILNAWHNIHYIGCIPLSKKEDGNSLLQQAQYTKGSSPSLKDECTYG